jgi:hypothetical protein
VFLPFLIIPTAYFLLFILSYFWVDLNLTLVSWGPVNQVLEGLKWLGYFNRPLSSRLYLVIILILTLIQVYLLFSRFIDRTGLRKLFLLAGGVVLIASLSYPFLSHDLFSYLFDAKIIWHYQQNPYHHPPNEFSADPWLRFMHWTYRTAPYGPVWLFYSLLPAVFSFSRFILNFYGLKLLNGLVFFVTGWLLLKITNKDKRVFAYWFFNPFLLIEFLVNSHNDLLMISLFMAALFFSRYKKNILTFLLFLASVAVKYLTILAWPLLLFRRGRSSPWAILFAVFGLIGFAWQIDRFQPWYFTWLYLAFPLIKMTSFSWLVVFTFQTLLLIFKYQPFLATGSWEATAYRSFFQVWLAALGIFFLTLLPIFKKLIDKFPSLPQEQG